MSSSPLASLLDRIEDRLETITAVLRGRWQLRKATQVGRLNRINGRYPVILNRWRSSGSLTIGEKCRFETTIIGIELGLGREGVLEIGDRVLINYGTSIAAEQSVKIGSYCSIGPFCNIIDNDYHRISPEERNETPEAQPVVLEENVWLGRNVTVLKGVTIGAGSVIAAGSVVNKDIPPRSIAGGMPAKVLKSID